MHFVLALHTISSGSVAARLCRSLRCYSVRSVGPELASGMGRNMQGSIAWPVASIEVNIAVFAEEPSAPVRIFMRRTLLCSTSGSSGLCRAPSWTRTLLGAAARVDSDDPGRESRRISPYGAASLHNTKR
jgi:hypothetical protein